MADIQNYSVEYDGNGIFVIQGQLTDSTTGELISDYTSENAIIFPNIITQMSDQYIEEFKQMIGVWVLSRIGAQ